jgi:hypothetical protein
MTLTYTRQKNGTFIKTGECKTRYVHLRVFRNGVWKEGLCPLQRTVIIERMETTEKEFLPADIYQLVGIESTMTEESKEKLKDISRRKKLERGEE